jgi:hypothetical protein
VRKRLTEEQKAKILEDIKKIAPNCYKILVRSAKRLNHDKKRATDKIERASKNEL